MQLLQGRKTTSIKKWLNFGGHSYHLILILGTGLSDRAPCQSRVGTHGLESAAALPPLTEVQRAGSDGALPPRPDRRHRRDWPPARRAAGRHPQPHRPCAIGSPPKTGGRLPRASRRRSLSAAKSRTRETATRPL